MKMSRKLKKGTRSQILSESSSLIMSWTGERGISRLLHSRERTIYGILKVFTSENRIESDRNEEED